MRGPASFLAALFFTLPADGAPEGYFELRASITLETGDTWSANGHQYRLFGVQSCIRGTAYTDMAGTERDCGEASMAVLAAYISDTSPICAPVAQSDDRSYVMCYASVGGEWLDLGTLLIASGYAFASLSGEGLPHHPPYAVSEQEAREKGAGLWQFEDVEHPAILLGANANAQKNKGR